MALNGEAPRAQFARADTDGSGALDATELAALFESMGKPVSVGAPRNLLNLYVTHVLSRGTYL
jgi:hypothetical protein